ncbi:hypothetical protein [Streptomyces sp. NPDC101165]|uniref:hypothetical protein n=1 Tax=Streptomyces sp. NPDC101165 TaxID=3366119 RepID=UPI0038081A09
MGAVAAIGTLLFTGITTYYQARVSMSQLSQAESDTARAARDQASRVNFWIAKASNGSDWLYLENRSSDPVTRMILMFEIFTDMTKPGQPSDISVQVVLPWLPPCSEYVFKPEMIKYSGHYYDRKHLYVSFSGRVPLGATFSQPRAIFSDGNGKEWHRIYDGQLEQSAIGSLFEWPDMADPHYARGELRVPMATKAISCG